MPGTGSAGFRDPGAVMRCLQCRHENPGDAKFCLECGRRLALMCASCATELPAGAKFCKECGTPVGTSAPAQSRTPAPDSYTPKHLAERIINSKAALEGERKQVTVLFADLKGSDAPGYYCEALALAGALGMRPLVAHCHLGLGKLYRGTGMREQAHEHPQSPPPCTARWTCGSGWSRRRRNCDEHDLPRVRRADAPRDGPTNGGLR